MIVTFFVPSPNPRCGETEGEIFSDSEDCLMGEGEEKKKGRRRGGKVDEDLKEEVDCGLPLTNGFVSIIM